MPEPTDFERLVSRLLAEPECEWIEYKDSLYDPGHIGRYASALANAARLHGERAGYVLWGVEDHSRETKSTRFDVRTKVHKGQPFEFWLRGRVSPKDHELRFERGTFNGHQMLVMTTAAASTVPVRFEGVPYIRIGSATPSLADHPDHERRLIEVLAQREWESDEAKENLTLDEVLDLLDVEAAVKLLAADGPGDPAERVRRLASFGAVLPRGDRHWSITNAGALLFARSLETFGPLLDRKAPRVVFYVGTGKIDVLQEVVGRRGYALGLDPLTEFLQERLPRREEIQRLRREELGVYPAVAWRELIVNALIHQEMTVRGAGPLIEIFEGRIEVTNPGAPLVDVDRLIDEPARSRNERVARLMRHMRFCDERGTGIDRIVQAAEDAKLGPPDFRVKHNGFVATLYGPRKFRDMTSDERVRACYQHTCLRWESGRRTTTNASLRERFDLQAGSAATISRLFNEASERGLITRADPGNASRAQSAYVPYWV